MGIREEIQRFEHAGTMPHRSPAGDNRLDARLVSRLGRLFFERQISASEYAAGVKYGRVVLTYLESTDAPEPFGSSYLDDISDEECLKRKIDMSAARMVLRCVDRRCMCVVDRVCVYDEEIGPDELDLLVAGLRALSGV